MDTKKWEKLTPLQRKQWVLKQKETGKTYVSIAKQVRRSPSRIRIIHLFYLEDLKN